MNSAARRNLLRCCRTRGMWNAAYRWSWIRQAVFNRNFKRQGFAWWHRVNHTVVLKPKRGQKR